MPRSRPRIPALPLLGLLLSLLSLAGLATSGARSGAPVLASVERGGRGEPTLVLIHGLGTDRGAWDRVAPLLERHHRLLVVDLPGHGASPPLPSISVRAVAEELDRTLRERGVKRAVLVGHSYGGLVALEEAAVHPDRARGVVSIDLATYMEADSGRVAHLDWMLAERYPLFVQGVFETMTLDSTQVDSVVAKAARVDRHVLAAYFHDAWTTDLRPQVRTLQMPVLLVATSDLWPAGESWTSARKRLGYETAGPTVGRRVFGSAHFVPMDQPDTLAAAILEFTKTLRK